MPTPLTVIVDQAADGTPRVTATGEIDLSNIATLKRALTDVSGGSRAPVTIDLGAVKYLDSAAINVLFDHADAVDDLHVIVHPLLVRVLTISGLSKIATVESASAPSDGTSH